MDLATLLARSYVCNWHQMRWFAGASLQGNRLAVADEGVRALVERGWLATFREHLPEVEIVVASVAERSKPAPAKAKPSIYNKAGRAYQQARLAGAE